MKKLPEFEFVSIDGTVVDTSSNSVTTVEGRGDGVMINGAGSSWSYVNSRTDHTRDVLIETNDSKNIRRRYYSDIPVFKGEKISEVSITSNGTTEPFALFFPDSRDTYFINKAGFGIYDPSYFGPFVKAMLSVMIVFGCFYLAAKGIYGENLRAEIEIRSELGKVCVETKRYRRHITELWGRTPSLGEQELLSCATSIGESDVNHQLKMRYFEFLKNKNNNEKSLRIAKNIILTAFWIATFIFGGRAVYRNAKKCAKHSEAVQMKYQNFLETKFFKKTINN